ncbi:hypothetical protein MPH_04031 [Macrophomina phaseolina MS6]|uniref:Uncharacterized protein n=1 Tax=Macrophomina phaseolina (strain MS6) TaxID=1126212 RepID=K2SPI3_MACPH|nr:hypothetical protein MPH_04031 [Macrophomina phaseolina MS6]
MDCAIHEERERQLDQHCCQLAIVLWPGRSVHVNLGYWSTYDKNMAILLVHGRGCPFSISSTLSDGRIEALLDLRTRLNRSFAARSKNPRCNVIRIARKPV